MSLLTALPFLYKVHDRHRRSTGSGGDYSWEMSYDDWNITTVPRSVHPHLIVKDHQHVLPPRATTNHLIGGHDSNEDDRLLRRLYEIKVNIIIMRDC